jgi:hypothetical protein
VPSALVVIAAGQVATPEVPSVQVNVTVTSELFHLATLAAGLAAAEMEGAVLSMLSVTLAVAVFPALSVACPEITWFAPYALTRTGAGQAVTPEVASLQVNVTVTLELFHPAALAPGLAAAEIDGALLSMFRVMLAVDLFPALSAA